MRVDPLRLPFDLSVRMPGSKSVANRALVAACLAEGSTTVRGATLCDDVRLLVENLIRMGYRLRVGPDAIEIEGGIPEAAGPDPVTLDCGLGGTTLRFLLAVAAVTPGTFVLTGAARLRERPIGGLVLDHRLTTGKIDRLAFLDRHDARWIWRRLPPAAEQYAGRDGEQEPEPMRTFERIH